MNNLPKTYIFDNFRFDADRLALYYKDVLVKAGDKKTMQVLAVLLVCPHELTTHDEIIGKVWNDNPLGVTPNHIGQYISKLRKIFAEFAPEKNYIETSKGRGYSFVGDISTGGAKTLPNITLASIEPMTVSPKEYNSGERRASPFIFQKRVLFFFASVPFFLAVFFAWMWYFDNNEEEIRRVVKESQLHESLVIYKNPSLFNEATLDKYWTSELDINANYDRNRIRDAVKKLNDEGRRYGDETKCEQFEFQSVEINRDKNFAVVKTLEKWFIAVYFNDGTLQKNRYVGPYFVSYILRKIDGQWLIEKSTTARINRPTPLLSTIEAKSEINPGQQFFVKITGQDFEAETVYIEVVGEGCPESRPCKVPNTALREKSKMSETVLDNVPLTLVSGEFQVFIRNGNSKISNPVYFKVP
jgi:DNA-binding winged helix-turn-helix (wHTH) protein